MVWTGFLWLSVGERRGTAVNPTMNLGYLGTCYSFKKGLFRRVAKNLNPSVLDTNAIHPLTAKNIRVNNVQECLVHASNEYLKIPVAQILCCCFV